MATCKDCIYYEVCKALNKEFKIHPKDYIETDLCAKQCTTFKDKSKFIELPCKVGEQLYRVKNLGKGTVTTTSLNENTFWRIVMQGEFGKTVFLTKEEAERVKKEREQE